MVGKMCSILSNKTIQHNCYADDMQSSDHFISMQGLRNRTVWVIQHTSSVTDTSFSLMRSSLCNECVKSLSNQFTARRPFNQWNSLTLKNINDAAISSWETTQKDYGKFLTDFAYTQSGLYIPNYRVLWKNQTCSVLLYLFNDYSSFMYIR